MKKTITILVIVTMLGIVAAYELPAKNTQTSPSTANGSRTASVAPTTTSATTSYKDGTYTGTIATGFYDTIQVKITVSGGRIINASTPILTGDSGHSNMINSYAAPQLNQQAISSQSAQIDGVSGASFTTQSYTESLQSAIDQAKA